MTGQELADYLLSCEVSEERHSDTVTIAVRRSGYLPYYRELTTHRTGMQRKVIIFSKRIIRKIIRFIIEPICTEQSSLNEYYGQELNRLKAELDECKEKIKQLEK
ncbi:hypothetical protein FYJ38_19420 [Clostridium sp. WB02_MRS01]|uniref:hypothetical protein n=1 Tax=Clostridium sp. WB02_MRS01 TaxID=2605777 RepID=UPI0012B30A51|nr:hypothetical protein [Clostridium sp. WB02_MRS01]MSS10797.1 hypothetical protein [Clostridium sp. WB02_MRS01]